MATMATMAIVERIAWLEQMHVREPERGWNRLAREWYERYEREQQGQQEASQLVSRPGQTVPEWERPRTS